MTTKSKNTPEIQTYDARTVALWFINKFSEHGDLITHLKVQKLLYYAEAWVQISLNRDLMGEEIEAWTHGPVVPSVFHSFKAYQWRPLPPTEENLDVEPEISEILDLVYDLYGDFSAKTLEDMTHSDEPWIEARKGYAPEERCNEIISKPSIREYFSNKFNEFI